MMLTVQKLKIVTWNIGFGAMGAEAEVKMDGGSRLIPSSNAHVKKNMNGILEYMRTTDADILLLQEVSFGSLLNYWHNIEHKIRKVLEPFKVQFATTFRFPLWLRFLRNEHGMSTYVHHKHSMQHIAPQRYKTSEVYYHIFHRMDNFIVTFVTPKNGEKQIAIINTHLASFDADCSIRKEQCSEVLAYAKQLHKDGHAVVIGADWNMLIGTLPDQKVLNRYRYKFPQEYLPKNWNIYTSKISPTVRSSNTSYKIGSTLTATIDGFVCSPDVTVESVFVDDLHFEFSDHQPVCIHISY